MPILFALWWACFVVGALLDRTLTRAFTVDSLHDLYVTNGLSIASELVAIAGAALAILVVRRTTARQETRRVLLGGAGH